MNLRFEQIGGEFGQIGGEPGQIRRDFPQIRREFPQIRREYPQNRRKIRGPALTAEQKRGASSTGGFRDTPNTPFSHLASYIYSGRVTMRIFLLNQSKRASDLFLLRT